MDPILIVAEVITPNSSWDDSHISCLVIVITSMSVTYSLRGSYSIVNRL